MLAKRLKNVFQEISQVYLTLLKVMVPAIIIVKILDLLGGTQWLADFHSNSRLPDIGKSNC